MLPRYRRLVEQLAQTGLLKVICGTDTLGVGINVPIRTVVFTGLAKFDGTRQRLLKVREFHQIAGRAGRAGFDTAGFVVVQAPDHVIERQRLLAKAGDDPKKRRKIAVKKPQEGTVGWTEETFERLRDAVPESLVSRMRVDHAMLLNVVNQPGDAVTNMTALMEDNHEDERGPRELSEQARRSATSSSRRRARVAARARPRRPHAAARDRPAGGLRAQPAARVVRARRARACSTPSSEHHALDVSLGRRGDPRRPVPRAHGPGEQGARRGRSRDEAEGIEYDERMELLEEVSYPKPLAEPLLDAFRDVPRDATRGCASPTCQPQVGRARHVRAGAHVHRVRELLRPRALEGLVLRYLSDAYRALRQTVPEQVKTDELDEIIEWLGETVRQTDSSLLDEWEALTDPESVERATAAAAAGAPPPPPRPITGNDRAFTVMVRNAMFLRVQLAARDRYDELAQLEAAAAAQSDPPGRPSMTEAVWEEALGAYWDEYETIGTGPDARSPQLLVIDRDEAARVWRLRQIVDDPEGNHDFAIVATVDLAASDAAGEPVIRTESFGRTGDWS
jgi:hypothetical protein